MSVREVYSGQLVVEPIELTSGQQRLSGVEIVDLSLSVSLNGALVSWPLVSGVGTPDVRATAGRVYWNELSEGNYTLRFFPNQLGLWGIDFSFSGGTLITSLTYSVVQRVSSALGGMRASFLRS